MAQDHRFKVSNGRGITFVTESFREAADFQYQNNAAETAVGYEPCFTLWIVDGDGIECIVKTQL